MSKKLLSFLLFIIILVSAVTLAGCNRTNTNTQEATVPTADVSASMSGAEVLGEYFAKTVEGNNSLYGTWIIDDFDYVSFIFRNDGLAELAMGTEGNFSSLEINEEKKTLETSFIVGLQGKYSYELSEDENTLTLTTKDTKTVLQRQKSYDFIPDAPKKAIVDEEILGWWKGDNGLIYFFGSDGIMYSNIISSETCYTYEAKEGQINAVYDCGGETNYDVSYSYKDGVLTLDSNDYKPFDPFEEE